MFFHKILGVVTNLKGEFVTQIALGKAHAVVLTSKGHIYTFGINNKFQCGREFVTSNKEGIFLLILAYLVVLSDKTKAINLQCKTMFWKGMKPLVTHVLLPTGDKCICDKSNLIKICI